MFQIPAFYEKAGRLCVLKQLQTFSSKVVLTLPKNESTFLLLALFCRVSLLLRLSGWYHCLMSYVVCLHSDLRVLTNYYQGIRINYHKLFEQARNLHVSI